METAAKVEENKGVERLCDAKIELSIYIGELSHSIYKRRKEHWKDSDDRSSGSQMVKHWFNTHKGERSPPLRFKVNKTIFTSIASVGRCGRL